MQFRHEVKHEISNSDVLILRQRLRAVMQLDPHAINGQYEIRSLYFDNLDDETLREKLDGVSVREKYRIRFYNHDPSVIHLERKFKHGGLGYKDSTTLTEAQARSIANGDTAWMASSTDEVILGFYSRIRNEGLAPKVIVDYTREPFVFAPGNVRVTLDYHIRTALRSTDFLNPNCTTIPVPDAPCILEVKWDMPSMPDNHGGSMPNVPNNKGDFNSSMPNSSDEQVAPTAEQSGESDMPGSPGEMPDGFDQSNLPDDFDPSNMQGGFGGNFPGQSSGDGNTNVPSGDVESNGENTGNLPNGGNMQMPGGDISFDMNGNNAPASDISAWIWLAVSIVVLVIGLIVAKKYRA